MSKYVIQGQTLTGIADAIRAQLGTEQQYTPESMAAAIYEIQGGGDTLADSILDGSISGAFKSELSDLRRSCLDATQVSSVYLTACKTIGAFAFARCKNLKYFYCAVQTSIDQQVFIQGGITVIVLPGDSVSSLLTSNSFTSTPIESGTGYIYVPDDLVEQYKVATNWAIFAKQIKGLSEIPAEVQEWLNQQGGATA